MTEIKTQKQVDKLSIKNLRGKNNVYLKVYGPKHLFIRLQKTIKGVSSSFVFRFTTIEKKSVVISFGTTSSITLQEAIYEASQRNFTKDYKRISFSGEKITINELLTKYIQAHNLKSTTLRSYITAVYKTCGELKDVPIYEYSIGLINKNFTINTLTQYMNILNILFKWAVTRKIVKHNPFENQVSTFAKMPIQHRAALNCQNFDTLNDATITISKYLTDTWEFNKKKPYLYKLWICHMILGTRVTETARIFKQFYSNCDYLIIETKTTRKGEKPNFRVPITAIPSSLILDIHETISKYTITYIVRLINSSIPPSYKEMLSAHGTRAIYRTVIELLNHSEFSTEAKEMYINHTPMTTVQAIYQRGDFLTDRKNIQIIYAQWIIDCLPFSISKNLISNQ